MKIKEVVDALEKFAPLPLQESYDNAGLQIGLTEAEVSGALLCLDVTEDVVDEAMRLGCNMVISHHPLLFRGVKRIAEKTQVERCIRMAIKNDICIYSAHTNLDNAMDGVNYRMADKLGLIDVEMLQPKTVRVREGASERNVKAGSGVLGYLPAPEDSTRFLERVKETFSCDCLMHNEKLDRPVQCVALCGGAGDFMIDEAIAREADAFVTGEMHYHVYMGHEQELQIAVTGHYESEQFTTEIFMELLSEACPTLPLFLSEVKTNPVQYM